MSVNQIEVSFGGSRIRLEIKDSAVWAFGPPKSGPSAAFTAAPQNAQTYSIVIQQPYVELFSTNGKMPVNAFLTVFVETSLSTLTLDVLNDGTVVVQCPVSNDSFACPNGTGGIRTLKLK